MQEIYLTSRISYDDVQQKAFFEHMKDTQFSILGYNPFNTKVLTNKDVDIISKNEAWEKENKISVLAVRGVLEKNQSIIGYVEGWTSTSAFVAELGKAVESDSEKIYIVFDTIGGEVSGIERLGNAIKVGKEKKDIVAIVENALSGGYWLASCCTQVIATEQASQIGSIGVRITHIDRSEQLKAQGLKVTEITAGKDKVIGSQDKPLSDEDLKQIQEKAEQIHEIFKTQIQENRNNIDIKKVATGKVFLAKEAEELGLVDYIQDVSQILKNQNENKGENMEYNDITVDGLKENAQAVYNQILMQGRELEQNRQEALGKISVAGYESIIENAKKDLSATVEATSVQILTQLKSKPAEIKKTEEQLKQDMLAVLRSENQIINVSPIQTITENEKIQNEAIQAVKELYV